MPIKYDSLLRIATIFVIAPGATAQVPAKSGIAITSWQEVLSRPVDGTTAHALWARNDSSVTLLVTGARFSNCKNVALACDSTETLWRVIKPGAKARLFVVEPAVAGQPFNADEQLEWRIPPMCATAAGAPPVYMSNDSFPPEPRQMILPPRANRYPRDGTTSHVTFFVNESGRVDSLWMTNITDPEYSKTFRKAMMTYLFSPGRIHGCPASGSMSVDVMFGTTTRTTITHSVLFRPF